MTIRIVIDILYMYIFFHIMSERYGWWTSKKRLTKKQLARLMKDSAISFKHADIIKEKLDQQREKDSVAADSLLENELNSLST